jgi:diguanylate cyclase (GGDEF)-like protein/PAS domain S-box-containing protein
MSDFLIVLSPDALIQTVNQTAIDILGYSEEELYNEPVEKLFCEADDFIFDKTGLGKLLKDETIRNVEACCLTKSGEKIPILFSGAVMTDDSGSARGIVCLIRDIKEIKQANDALEGSHDFLKTIIHSLHESVSIINVKDYSIETANKVFLQNFNLHEHEVAGKICHKLIRDFDEPCAPPDYECPLQETIKTKQFSVVEHTINLDDDTPRYLEISTSPIFGKDGALIQVVHISRDITESKAIKRQLEKMAHFDELTSLPNRSLFFDRLNQAMVEAKRYEKKLGVLFLDLDNFKTVNDTLGHDAGDLVLKEAAARLGKCVRECDTVGRMGGDEFIILGGNLDDIRGAEKIAERILKFFSIPFNVEDTSFDIGVSIGISFYPKDADDADTLVKNADTAMYWAKQKGKNTFCLHYSAT